MAQTSTDTAARELVLTRIIDAPRELVFRMWTDPVHLAKWWGPRDFTNPVCEIDPRPGGALRIVMRAPDGTDYPMAGTFREIVAPERLIFTNCALDRDGNVLLDGLTTVIFAEHSGKTRLTVQTRATALVHSAARYLEGMQAGWEQTLDGLEQHAQDTAARELVVTRIIDAPRDIVFSAWADPKQAAQWWGPQGFTTISCDMDVRPGGAYRACMRSPEGTQHCRRGRYREVVKPERLVFTFAWEDANGNPGHETLVRVTFADLGGKTELTLHQAIFDTVGACDAHRAGWTSTLERFAEYLGTRAANRRSNTDGEPR
jgi:uncharacterized protein YndB with AHSA1/START domain